MGNCKTDFPARHDKQILRADGISYAEYRCILKVSKFKRLSIAFTLIKAVQVKEKRLKIYFCNTEFFRVGRLGGHLSRVISRTAILQNF